MDENRPEQGEYSELRRRAEAHLTEQRKGEPTPSAPDVELRRLVHELSVHQLELEMQNEELQRTAENLAAARMELQKGLERFKDLYDFAPVGYLTMTRDNRIAEANLTAASLLGIERSCLKGAHFTSFITAEDLPVFNALIVRLFNDQKPKNCQVRLGSALPHFIGEPHEDPPKPGKTLFIDAAKDIDEDACRITLSDITMQKEVERENASLQENLAQAQKIDSIGRLAGGIAHDFNNMLAAILGNAELAIRKSDPDHPMRSELEAIIKAARRSAELTSQLLAFARKQSVMPRVLELNEAIDASMEMLRRLIGEHIVIDWLPAAGPDYVRMDPVQIDQILINLCVNARDSIAGHGRIIIRTSRVQVTPQECSLGHCCKTPGDYMLISVTDNGSGIDKNTLPHIFEPFFTTKEPGQGTGLGLSTIYGIVKQNSGFLECTSEPGKGTTFALYLPRCASNVPAVGYVPPPEQALPGKGSILLVEDEPDILGFIKQILENSGYAVHSAQCPAEAIRIASEGRNAIQLLLTNVVMPDMNGSELAKKLSAMLPGLKVIFMSGYTADIVAGYAAQDGDIKFIQKPFSISTLVTAVEEVLKS